jgi:phosphoglycolate phosphatase-like HAD superfamily hydrolase
MGQQGSEVSIRLVLFDIDGTLLRGGPKLRQWFGGALEEVFQDCGDLDGYSFAGKTDPQIVSDLMTAAGFSASEVKSGLPLVKHSYLERLRRRLRTEDLELLPGVLDLLSHLAAYVDVTLGLLTGNWETGARLKLSCVGLNHFFPFGAYGDGHRSRMSLPPVALERAAAVAGRPFSPDETLLVGDSLLDVECARAHGLRSAAVATGYASEEELKASGADWVLPHLGEAHRIHPVFSPR